MPHPSKCDRGMGEAYPRTVNTELEQLLAADYGEEWMNAVLTGYGACRPVTLRFNRLKCTPEEGKRKLTSMGLSFSSVDWYEDAVLLQDASEEDLLQSELCTQGEVYLQSLSSMLPPLVLGAKAGESVLDMTAAPGGKTTQIASLTNGKALITACERDKFRFERLKFNLQRQGANRVTALHMDACLLDDAFSFDKILLDAPCSGSGTVHWGKKVRIDASYVEKCASLQEKLLKKAFRLLKHGGEMVYSTCSVLKRENETVIRRALHGENVSFPEMTLPETPRLPCELGACLLPTDTFEGFYLVKIKKE